MCEALTKQSSMTSFSHFVAAGVELPNVAHTRPQHCREDGGPLTVASHLDKHHPKRVRALSPRPATRAP